MARSEGSLSEEDDAFFLTHTNVVRSHVAPKTVERDCGFARMWLTGEMQLRLVTTTRIKREACTPKATLDTSKNSFYHRKNYSSYCFFVVQTNDNNLFYGGLIIDVSVQSLIDKRVSYPYIP